MNLLLVLAVYALAGWIVTQLRSKPLQPDQLHDDLGDLDMTERQRVITEDHWWENPTVNVVLSRRAKR